MAWIDDRVWCHPTLTDLTDRAFRVWINSLAYSFGMETGGVLTPGQLKLIGCSQRTREELIGAGLWVGLDCGFIEIHKWQERNGKQAERKKVERERMRRVRASKQGEWFVRTKEWQRARHQVFERDGGKCADCGTVVERWHADHVPDRATLLDRGDDIFDIQFLHTRCPSCHGRRHMSIANATQEAL